jgi:polyamine oxidase
MSAVGKHSIAIIGAGVSGLQAARTILTSPHSQFFNVTIYEARERLGGRVHTEFRWSKFPLDLGPPSSQLKLT